MQIIKSDGKTAITYPYTPNAAAAYIFIVIFALGLLCHIFLLFHLRAAYFISFIIGATCETFGYYGRSWSSRDQPNVKPYVLQYLLILPAPIFLVATVYMSLGRIATALDATKYTMIRPSRLTKLFIFLDIFCFAVQITGAGLESTTDPKIGDLGSKVVTAGVILQMLCSIWFVLIIYKFQKQLRRKPTIASKKGSIKWWRYLSALYVNMVLIMLRNLVRAVQEMQGFYGTINSNEAFSYVFDAVPMATIVWIFVVLHPSRLIKIAREATKLDLPTSAPVVEDKEGEHAIAIPSKLHDAGCGRL